MSLYYEAASILTDQSGGGSLKSRIYNDPSKLKSRPAQLYALITETGKYDAFLKEVIDSAGILKLEPKLTPLLSLLLVHDYLFSDGDIAASKDHVLKLAILRHKGRLSSEFTKARIRRKCATVSQLKVLLAGDSRSKTILQPRWVRINNLVPGEQELYPGYSHHPDLPTFVRNFTGQDGYHRDETVPDLLAMPPGIDLTKSSEYKTGRIILQDKASCFPAYILLGDENEVVGDVVDACAAPGNKTTHLASILWSRQVVASKSKLQKAMSRVIACERDPRRSEILQKMTQLAGAEKIVTVLPKQDFFALDPGDDRFANVTHFLLDPTCSGSGIVGREDVPKLKLPEDPRNLRKHLAAQNSNGVPGAKGKKRKRDDDEVPSESQVELEEEESPKEVDEERIQKLSNLQTRIVEHAMSFPTARRIAYSTCSLHATEDEMVVARVLHSDVAKAHGWRLLRRAEQVKGMREWRHRGVEVKSADAEHVLTEDERSSCIRCYPGTVDGTMGFFVCCFVRGGFLQAPADANASSDEFSGFED